MASPSAAPQDQTSPDQTTRVDWRGINHLALITPDMDATVRFYHGVLGMDLVATIAVGPMRHYFFRIGKGNTIAFFEWSGTEVESFTKPAGVPPDFPAQFDHVSFNVEDEAALLALQDRIRAREVECTDVVDHGFMHSIYFTDPNGIALEATYWLVDATTVGTGLSDDRFFGDDDPVPAVRELAAGGRLDWTPRTILVDEGADLT